MRRTSKYKSGAPPMASAEQFRHEPLDLSRRTIRVVRILPGLEGTTLQCEMKILNLDDYREYAYVCLSYTWGPADEGHSFLLDRRAFVVRQNLWRFLLTARAMKIEDWLWIDAISINQSDVNERNHQVHEMAAIYRSAKHVLIWPGETDIWLRYISLVAQIDRLQPHLGVLPNRPRAHRLTVNLLASMCRRLYRSKVYKISSLPYWRRLWIVQEVLLAKEVFLIFGNVRVPWESLDAVLRMYIRPDESWPYGDDPSAMYSLFRTRRTQDDNYALGPSLMSLLRDYRRCDCADPRDRVFGLLGLVESDRLPPVSYELNTRALLFHLLLFYHGSDPSTVLIDNFTMLSLAFELKSHISCPHSLEVRNLDSICGPQVPKEYSESILVLLSVSESQNDDDSDGAQFQTHSEGTMQDICESCSMRCRLTALGISVVLNQPTPHTLWIQWREAV